MVYSSLTASPAASALQTQVTAYSKWQAELMAAGGPEPELSFWRSQLAPLPKMGGLAALPIDHPRPQVRRHADKSFKWVSCARTLRQAARYLRRFSN